jgi:subtilisin family serine protease
MRIARLGLGCLLLAICGAGLSAAPVPAGRSVLAEAAASPAPPPEYAPGRLIAKLSPASARALLRGGAVPAGLGQVMRAAGVRKVEPLYRGLWSSPAGAPVRARDKLAALRLRYPERAARATWTAVGDLENTLLLHLPPQADVLAAAEALRRDPEVVWVSPDWRITLAFTPDDPRFIAGQQWGLLTIAAPAAWDVTLGESSAVIAVVDTGVRWDHPDLAHKVWTNPEEIAGNGVDDDRNGYPDDVRGWDFGDGDADPMDDVVGHGTMCAGVAAAATNNAAGIAGAAPHCPILAVKAADSDGALWSSAVAAGIVYATDNGASVISLSLGGRGLKEAVDYALAAGTVVVAAAGNYGGEEISSPAARVGVIAVGASVDDPDDPRADFFGWWASDWGAGLDVLAPGHSILATSLDASGYGYADGTSLAAPFVAAAAALVLSHHPAFTREQVGRALRAAAVPGATGLWDRQWGAGVLDLAGTLAIAQVPEVSLTNPLPQRQFVFSDPPPYTAAQDVPVIVHGLLPIEGSVGGPGFARYSLSYSRGYDPDPATRVVLREGTEPFSGTFAYLDASALAPGVYNVELAVTSTEGRAFREWALFYTDPSQHPGWPVSATAEWLSPDALRAVMGPFEYPPTTVDLDGDGAAEILQESRAFRASGTVLPSWDQYQHYGADSYSVAGDLDGDGRPEVVYQDASSRLQAARADGSPLPGWRAAWGPTFTGRWGHAATADLDQDRKDEIVLGWRSDGSAAGASTGLYVLRADGSVQPGWPFAREAIGLMWPPAVADADADGELEIAWPASLPDQLYLLRADGQVEAGWPVATEGDALGQPAFADLDGDGRLEVVLACSDAKVRAWRSDGTPLPGWPVALLDLPWNGPAVGDLDGDGLPDVVVGSLDGRVYAWHGDGTSLSGWPVTAGPGVYTHSPLIGDVDNDGWREVVVGTLGRTWDHPDIADWARIHAFRADGAEAPGFPKEVIGGVAGLAFGDVDGDGKAELAAALYGTALALWDLGTPYDAARFPWPMTCATPSHRGVYAAPAHAVKVTCSAPIPEAVGSEGSAQLSAGAEDTLGHALTFSWSDGGTGGTFVPSPDVQSPTYRAPVNCANVDRAVVLTVTVTCDGLAPTSARAVVDLTLQARADFSDVPFSHWAFSSIESCFYQGIVQGYGDGTYQPEEAITRDQMAVYLARAVAGGDANVPEDTDGATFTDVDGEYWAYRYIEYCAARHIVQGYADGAYQPEAVVTRDQMAVYIARAAAGGDDQVPEDVGGEPFFSDMPTDHWAYRYVEYCHDHAIVDGYDDGAYHPDRPVTRDQMAVYLQRAFALPM